MLTLSGLDPSRPADNQAELDRFRQLGEAAVFLAKSAGPATISYGLAGRLICSKSGWGLLEVPNALIRGAFDALHEVGAELPPSHGKNLRAHISVLRPEELEQIGGKDKVDEWGHTFRYTLGPVREVQPEGWDEMSNVWFIEIRSPELEKLRKSYGLSATPKNGEFQFHATIAVRRKKVTRPGEEIRKAAADRQMTIAVDLDGTLAKPGPFKGPDHFYLPRRGAAKFMKGLKAKGHRVIINTCRGDKESIEEWLNEHGIPYDHVNDNPDQPDGTSDKIVADAYVDDRAVHADGDWSRIIDDIESRLEQRKAVKKGSIPEPIHRLLNLPPIQDWLADKSLQGNLVYSDGSNLAIQAQRRAERRMAWDAAKQNAKLDQPKYRDFLGGLATLSGTKPSPKLVDRASNDMTTLSPYVATMFAQKRGNAEEVMPYLDDILALVMAHRAKQNNPGPAMPKLTLGLPPDSVEMPKVAKVHHTAAVTVQRRDSEILVCPHCNKELETKDIYRDAKGWTFCRPCFRKGKGSIKIPEWIGKIEKSAIETPDVEHLARCSEPVDANEFILP